jgi:hypothetical protein
MMSLEKSGLKFSSRVRLPVRKSPVGLGSRREIAACFSGVCGRQPRVRASPFPALPADDVFFWHYAGTGATYRVSKPF